MFEKIIDATVKAVRGILVRCYDSDTLVKKVNLQFLHKQYENLSMKSNEKVPDYTSLVIIVTNETKSCAKTLSKQTIIEMVLRSLTS